MNNLVKVYLVRHAESGGNVANQLGLDTSLTEKGELQAKKLAKKLKSIRFDAVYSSDLLRAEQTAEIISSEHQLVVITKNELRERNHGSLAGKSRDEAIALMKKLKHFSEKERKEFKLDEEYESENEMMTRFITFLREIAIENTGYVQIDTDGIDFFIKEVSGVQKKHEAE